jgi:hypothetical protein
MGHGNRKDAPWNLVAICREAHETFHGRLVIGGRVLCWWILHKRGSFDVAAIREFWRQCPLAWIERHLEVVPEDWLREMGETLLKECE